MQWLPQDLDYLFGFVQVCPAQKINDDAVSAEQSLAESLGLALTVKQLDLLVGRRDNVGVPLDHRSTELVRFFASPQRCMVVTHHLEQGMTDQAIDARDKNPLALLDLRHGNLGRNCDSLPGLLRCTILL